MKRILILEDDQRLAEVLGQEFTDRGYEVQLADKISQIKTENLDYAVLDMRLSGEFGLDAIGLILKTSPACRIVILSGYGSITTAVESVKRGAIDYLTKPASFALIEAALMGKKLSQEVELERRSLSEVENEYIDFVLTKNSGNISKTAKQLGLHRQSLQRKLKKYT
jgi:two-component system response regulator RegA